MDKHLIYYSWLQDDTRSSFSQLVSTPTASSTSDDSSSITPPEAWGGGERLSDKFTHNRQSVNLPSRFATLSSTSLSSGSMFSGLQDLPLSTSQMSMSSATSSSLNLASLRTRDTSSNQDTTLGLSEHVPFSFTSLSQGTKGISGQANLEPLGSAFTLPRRFSSYAERISTTPSFSEGASLSVGSPKTKKTGSETREELMNSLLSRSDVSSAIEAGNLPSMNVRNYLMVNTNYAFGSQIIISHEFSPHAFTFVLTVNTSKLILLVRLDWWPHWLNHLLF